MAKRKCAPKGLRELKNIPADRWISDNGGATFERRDILDHATPLGRYEIDKVVTAMNRSGGILIERPETESIRLARGLIDIAGAAAIRQARNELSASSRHKDIVDLHRHLSDIRDLGHRAIRAKPSDLAGFIARDDDVHYPDDGIRQTKKSFQYAESVMEELLEDLGNLVGNIDRYLSRYTIKHRSSSAEPLTNWFMMSCAGFWHSFSGSWLKKGDCIDFRQFLAAGWIDLRFPEPTDRNGTIKPIEDHIRERLAASDIFDHYGGGN